MLHFMVQPLHVLSYRQSGSGEVGNSKETLFKLHSHGTHGALFGTEFRVERYVAEFPVQGYIRSCFFGLGFEYAGACFFNVAYIFPACRCKQTCKMS